MKVLVLDDRREQKVLVHLLRSHGPDARGASSLDEATAEPIRDWRPDRIVAEPFFDHTSFTAEFSPNYHVVPLGFL